MVISNGTANTLIGKIDTRLLWEALRLAGIHVHETVNGDGMYSETIKSNLVRGKRVNPNNDRKANESAVIKSDFYFPVKYYNFEIALWRAEVELQLLQDFEPYEVVARAIEIVKKELFEGDEPVYLPSKDDDEIDYEKSYVKILKESEQGRRELFEKLFEESKAKEKLAKDKTTQ